jgi:hypothetical protein
LELGEFFSFQQGQVDLLWFQESETARFHILPEGVVQPTWQCVWFVTLLPWSEDNLEVETGQLFSPSSLSAIIDLGFSNP